MREPITAKPFQMKSRKVEQKADCQCHAEYRMKACLYTNGNPQTISCSFFEKKIPCENRHAASRFVTVDGEKTCPFFQPTANENRFGNENCDGGSPNGCVEEERTGRAKKNAIHLCTSERANNPESLARENQSTKSGCTIVADAIGVWL